MGYANSSGRNSGMSISMDDTSTGEYLMALTSGGTERMRVRADGNVGIGTSAPSSLLHVTKDTANSNYLVYFYNSGSQALDHGLNTQIASSTATAYGLRVNTGGDSNALAVMGDGKVGIGTGAPAYKLQIAGDIVPTADATYDLGHTASLDWNVLYIRTVSYTHLTLPTKA